VTRTGSTAMKLLILHLHCHVIMLNFMWPFIGYTGLRIMFFRMCHSAVSQKNRILCYATVKTSDSHSLCHFPGHDCDYSHGAEDWNCVGCYLFSAVILLQTSNLKALFLSSMKQGLCTRTCIVIWRCLQTVHFNLNCLWLCNRNWWI